MKCVVLILLVFASQTVNAGCQNPIGIFLSKNGAKLTISQDSGIDVSLSINGQYLTIYEGRFVNLDSYLESESNNYESPVEVATTDSNLGNNAILHITNDCNTVKMVWKSGTKNRKKANKYFFQRKA